MFNNFEAATYIQPQTTTSHISHFARDICVKSRKARIGVLRKCVIHRKLRSSRVNLSSPTAIDWCCICLLFTQNWGTSEKCYKVISVFWLDGMFFLYFRFIPEGGGFSFFAL